jgi:nitrogenase molybdenum-iron protein beta chain
MSICIEQPRYACALGAHQSVVAIKRAVPVLHAGPGCGPKIAGLIGQGEGYAGGSTIPCTNTNDNDVVFGGEARLREVLDGALKVIDADLYVVMTGCANDLIGDDAGQIAAEYRSRGESVVHVETGGFKFSNYAAHERLCAAIVEQYVEPRRDPKAGLRRGLVNVFASVPYQDPFWIGNLGEIKRLLAGLGLEANLLFGPDSGGLEEWQDIPRAEFNLVIGAWSGLEFAGFLKDKYATPFFHFPYLPIGGKSTSEFLRALGEYAELNRASIESFIAVEEEAYYSHVEHIADFILEFRYGLPRRYFSLLDASYSLGVAKFLLHELGIIPVRQFIVDGTPESYRAGITEAFAAISAHRQAPVEFLEDAGSAHDKIREERGDSRFLIIGSSWEGQLAEELGADLLVASVPAMHRLILERGYAGYKGGLRLAEDIYDRVLATYR